MKIEKIEDCIPRYIRTIDEYVPINVVFPENKAHWDRINLYRWISKESALIEVAVSAQHSKIAYITIVNIKRENVIAQSEGVRPPHHAVGNPSIEMQAFAKRGVVTQEKPLVVYLGDDYVEVMLDAQGHPFQCLDMGGAMICMDEARNIMGFRFEGLSCHERDTILRVLC